MPGDWLSYSVWSDRFIQALENVRATGFTPYRIKVTLKGKLIPGYSGYRISGRGNPIDKPRSNWKQKGTLEAYRGLWMLNDEWDGSDVFAIPNMGISVYLSARVAEMLLHTTWSGIEFLRNDRVESPLHL